MAADNPRSQPTPHIELGSPYSIDIKDWIPRTLDLDDLYYDVWRKIFETHCSVFGVLGHIDGTSVASSPDDKEWKQLDALVTLWIYNTITESLYQMMPRKGKGATAREIWLGIENLFTDVYAVQLHNELRNLKTRSDLLAEKNLVNSLTEKFDNNCKITRHHNPFHTFVKAEHLSKTRQAIVSHSDHSSSSTILYTSPLSQPSPQNFQHHNHHGNRGRNNSKGGPNGRNRQHSTTTNPVQQSPQQPTAWPPAYWPQNWAPVYWPQPWAPVYWPHPWGAAPWPCPSTPRPAADATWPAPAGSYTNFQ